MDVKLLDLLTKYVNDPAFMKQLTQIIDTCDNPMHKWKYLTELMDYVIPKVKTIDPAVEEQDATITINFES